MNATLRMILVLGMIAALAAGLLAGVNAWTAPIIEENANIRLQNTLASVIDADEFEEQDGTDLKLWHARKGGELVGYVVRLLGQGYSSAGIDILVGLDTEAKVQGVLIFAHSETPGLGDRILNPKFLGQFVGKGIDDPIARNEDVDGITGATASAMAVINGVRRAVQFVGEYAGLIERTEIDFTAIPDGVYTGVARGFGGDLTVEVEIAAGKLVEVRIISHSESAGYSDPAITGIPRAMVDQQQLDVDTVSGATVTSQAIINAVRNALAEFVSGDEEVVEVDISALADGRYVGTADSFGGPLTVEVALVGGRIEAIVVLAHQDTKDIAEPAFASVIDAIVAAQDLEVDLVSGATVSSAALIKAVTAALLSDPIIDIGSLAPGTYVGEAESFGGTLKVEVDVADGAIAAIRIVSHQDTDYIAEPAFGQLIATIVENQHFDVDVISGATVSCEALVAAVQAALRGLPKLDIAAVPDGQYAGTGQGFMAAIEVVVTVSGGQIKTIEVVSHNDTSVYMNKALAVIDNILAAQALDVDMISGATGSSAGILEAVENALRSAGTQ